MSWPRTRKLWIETLKKKIWDHAPAHVKKNTADYSGFTLYNRVIQLNYKEGFRIYDGEFLHSRWMITSNPLFPQSKEPGVDIVVVSAYTTTWRRKRSESQSGESISFSMVFSCL